MLFDAHCHLDWAADPEGVAAGLETASTACLACTVTPDGYLAARRRLAGCSNVLLGAGLHPWWLANGTCGEKDVRLLCELLPEVSLIGEIGLDFSPRRSNAASNELQVRAFRLICAAAAFSSGGKRAPALLSIHAVGSAEVALDVLEATGVLAKCNCVLHWFSGTSDDLARARHLGCWFSMGERMLATRRGREYARQMPANRLLLETDLPEQAGSELAADTLLSSLGRARAALAQARGLEADELDGLLDTSAAELLDGVCALTV